MLARISSPCDHWRLSVIVGMWAFTVVPPFDVADDPAPCCRAISKPMPPDITFEKSDEGLDYRVVPTHTGNPHRLLQAVARTPFPNTCQGVLAPMVAVKDGAFADAMMRPGHREWIHDHVARISASIAQPTTARAIRSITVARYIQPSSVRSMMILLTTRSVGFVAVKSRCPARI